MNPKKKGSEETIKVIPQAILVEENPVFMELRQDYIGIVRPRDMQESLNSP